MTITHKYEGFGDLPKVVPLFPLPGALIFPGISLPLNIFEPRYLAMTSDALSGDRWIGIVQPLNVAPHPIPNDAEIFGVGSLAKLDSYENLDDDRMLITLKGIIRFQIVCEVQGKNGYRLAEANYQQFEGDLVIEDCKLLNRKRLISAAENYFQNLIQDIDLSTTTDINDTMLLNALCMASPFTIAEKQALLECKGTAERGELLSNLMEMTSMSDENILSSSKH